MKTKCQLTGVEFEGRGKNHPALREILDDAMRNGTRNAVVAKLEEAREAGVTAIEDFVAIAAGADVAAKVAAKEAQRQQLDAESERKNRLRRLRERNTKLRRAGFRWVRKPDAGVRFVADQDELDYLDDDEVVWVLLDPDGNEISVDDAMKLIS